jgi:glyoxylase-like metal-dependent hydrolase (beta-lactamase superfamily II)
MANSQLDPPSKEEIEISLFGPGYGEAIALHIGEGKWLLVDSCLGPDHELPASLHYLDRLKVNVKNDIKLIVVTHWHDDHIRGISTIFNVCESATIAIPDALRTDEFLMLASLYDQPIARRNSGLNELNEVFHIANLNTEGQAGICAVARRAWARETSSIYSTQSDISSSMD